MSPLLFALLPNAFALENIQLPGKACPPSNHPCLSLLDMHMEIFPPDKMKQVVEDLSPSPFRWLEIEVTTYSGEQVEVTVNGQFLDPRFGLLNPDRTMSWVVAVPVPESVMVEVRNPSRTTVAEYDVYGIVLDEAK